MFSKLVALAFVPGLAVANVLTSLPVTASEGALKFQPLMDWDTDTCYQTAAIGADGTVNPGLSWSSDVRECRSEDRLLHSNTYSREKCNNYWCAYMYGYYSEMDYVTRLFGASGHDNDWEHVIVWTLHDEVMFVSWSAHGNYDTQYHTEVRFEGTRPKFVGHHGYVNSASLRRADEDDEDIENAFGEWFTAPLVSVEKMDPELRQKFLTHDFGSAHMDLSDERFNTILREAAPWDALNNEGFNPDA